MRLIQSPDLRAPPLLPWARIPRDLSGTAGPVCRTLSARVAVGRAAATLVSEPADEFPICDRCKKINKTAQWYPLTKHKKS